MSERSATDQPSMIDWDFAVSFGARTAKRPPEITPEDAAQAVAELRAGAARSAELVNDWCELGGEVGLAPLLVVDREGWIRANASTFAMMTEPMVDRITSKSARRGITHAIGSKATGGEVGALLGFLSSRILGQFDPFHGEHGRLMLVAPNVVQVERDLDVDPAVFRLWVCLHEEAHRVQFTSVPWLADHVRGLVQRLTETVDTSSFTPEKIKDVLATVRGNAERPSGGLAEALSSPAQRALIDEVTGVMSLLEGHADFVMDAVGNEAIGPDAVAVVRAKFNERRKGLGSIDKLVRRLLGLEAKAAQYRDGYRFVETVVGQVGKDGFNAVFSSPETLPSKAEILDPDAWIARIHPQNAEQEQSE
ncbi:zinc-dependent metalloprotease [Nocardioides yefusunii]|uniref:Zinc-dependent metalloprotease n=1 Tax=Nocardioides yefusunii TaxID=2500546 RepID=A0ABW1R011_9ACTN|nr:zinc-dependent metalloprotease [Nocardioides yefusunii]